MRSFKTIHSIQSVKKKSEWDERFVQQDIEFVPVLLTVMDNNRFFMIWKSMANNNYNNMKNLINFSYQETGRFRFKSEIPEGR